MRALLIVATLLPFVAACTGGDADPSPTPEATQLAVTRTPRPSRVPTPTPVPTPSPTPDPTPVPTPSGAFLNLDGSQPRQGGFLVVRLYSPPAGISFATAYFTGIAYTMLPSGDHWSTVIGVPTYETTGGYPIEVIADPGDIASAWTEIGDGGFAYETIDLPPDVGGLLQDTERIEAERVEVQSILAGFTPDKYWSGPWIMPAAGEISNAFGLQRSFNGGASYSPHTGTDIASAQGTPIYAAASGVVAFASQLYLYGNSVIIDHGLGVFSSYNHMDSLVATGGQYVNQGDLIGYMGMTGFATGPHVHWEANVHGVHTDPILWTQASIEP